MHVKLLYRCNTIFTVKFIFNFAIQGADGGSIELPSFEATPTKPHSPTKVKFSERSESGEPISVVTRGNRDDNDDRGDDSDSSDWSSSASDGEDGEGRGGEGERGGGGAMGEMKPSHHTNLIAEWEWRTMADSSDTRYMYVYTMKESS